MVTAWATGPGGFLHPKRQGQAAQRRRSRADESRSSAPAHGNGGAGRHRQERLKTRARREKTRPERSRSCIAEDELLFEKLLDHTTTEGLESLLESDLRGVKRSKREQTESVKTTEEPPQTISSEENLVKHIDIVEEIDTVENREKEPPQSDMGEVAMRRFFSTRKAAENVSQTEQMQRSEFDASLQPTAESRGIASVGLEKAPAAGPSPAAATAGMALDDWRQGFA